jgi:G6PDH family F420-dependent oxidoreductase
MMAAERPPPPQNHPTTRCDNDTVTSASIGYAMMLERFAPADAIAHAEYAEQLGFSGTVGTDHFQPWLSRHGQASFVWSVLGALGARTTRELGAGAVTAGARMHPAAIAQASATIAALYPGRHWLALGAGEALNEHVTGGYWPEAPERIARMFDAIEVIRKLFASGANGRPVRHHGSHFELESTQLWTASEPPAAPPRILVATAGPVAAKRAGRAADGILTIGTSHDKAAALVERFDEGLKEARAPRGDTLRVVRIDLSWAHTDEEAMANALAEWPLPGIRFPRSDVRSPGDFEQLARTVRPEDFDGRMLVSSDPDVHRAHLQRFVDLGVDRIFLHNAGPDQRAFIETFAREVLPKVTR